MARVIDLYIKGMRYHVQIPDRKPGTWHQLVVRHGARVWQTEFSNPPKWGDILFFIEQQGIREHLERQFRWSDQQAFFKALEQKHE